MARWSIIAFNESLLKVSAYTVHTYKGRRGKLYLE